MSSGVGGASSAEDRLEPRRECLESRAVAAPVVRLALDDVLQRLGEHRTLHRVPVLALAVAAVPLERLDGAVRSDPTEVPRHPVRASVDVAGAARDVSRAGRRMRVVEERPSAPDRGRRRVVERRAGEDVAAWTCRSASPLLRSVRARTARRRNRGARGRSVPPRRGSGHRSSSPWCPRERSSSSPCRRSRPWTRPRSTRSPAGRPGCAGVRRRRRWSPRPRGEGSGR